MQAQNGGLPASRAIPGIGRPSRPRFINANQEIGGPGDCWRSPAPPFGLPSAGCLARSARASRQIVPNMPEPLKDALVVIFRHLWTTMRRMTERVSIKMPVEMKVRLKGIARARQTNPSALLRQALDLVLSGEAAAGGSPSCHDLCADLFEGLEKGGSRNLATNPKHLASLGK